MEKYSNEEDLNASSALRVMDKLRDMNLNLDELRESRAGTVVSNLRKHSDTNISSAAKLLRLRWKELVIETAAHTQAPPISNNSEVSFSNNAEGSTSMTQHVSDTRNTSE